MMKTRYLKVIRELTTDYTKNLLLVLAIAIGLFGIGTILGGYSVIKREMSDNYLSTVPASATIELEDSISAELLEKIRELPGVHFAERHGTISGRMKIGNSWHRILFFVIDDFKNKKTNKVFPVAGLLNPPIGSMLVERSSLPVMNAEVGEDITVITPDGRRKEIKLSGVVHDPSLAPAWQEDGGYGYINQSTLHWLGERGGFNQLRLLVSRQPDSREIITQQAAGVAGWLEENGYSVHEIQVPPPGCHPHQSQMETVMSIFLVFSFLILVLGSILAAVSVATMMVRQVRQIGIMKTIGATAFQVSGLYLLMTAVLCVVAILVAIPLSRLAAAGFYQQIAVLLNLEIRNDSIPFWVPLVQGGAGILVPLAAAIVPVVRGSRVSVRAALDHNDATLTKPATGSWVLKLSTLVSKDEIFRLSIRNVFRQRKRLLMTLALLTAGGATFMTAINVSKAWDENLNRIYEQRTYDLEVRLNDPVSESAFTNAISGISGIKKVEGWFQSSTSFFDGTKYEITHTYPDKGHGSFHMQALPVPTDVLNPSVVEGAWLRTGSEDGVVLNQLARELSPGVKVGDRITLSLNGRPVKLKVAGFTEDVGTPATAYLSLEDLSKYVNTSRFTMFRIGYEDRFTRNKGREIERALLNEDISVDATIPVWRLHNAIAAHMEVMVRSLLAMAMLMALVGSLGMMSTMSMSIIERTREIGVMRAIGATPGRIRRLIVGEGLVIGVLSILIALVFSVVLSAYMGQFLGNMAFRTPLSLVISGGAIAIWVGIIFLGSLLATLVAARRSNKMATREALAYE